MSEFDREDMEAIAIQKNHGPGGELPTLGSIQKAADKKAAPKKKEETAVDAQWKVAPSNDVRNISNCIMQTVPTVCAAGVVYWWQQSGQLVETTGFYALIVLALFFGLIIGKAFNR